MWCLWNVEPEEWKLSLHTTPSNFRKVSHIYLHPEDNTTNYPAGNFQHNSNTSNLKQGLMSFGVRRVFKWGLYDNIFWYNDVPEPLEQFIDVLVVGRYHQ